MSTESTPKSVKETGANVSKQSTDLTATQVDIIDPVSSASNTVSAKLLPAPAPKVNAWGTNTIYTPPKPVTAAPSTSDKPSKGKQNGIRKEHWPSAEEALVKDSNTSGATETSPTSKQGTSFPTKVKSSGKEKWVPYEATIVISSNIGNGNSKKKSNSSSTNNNGNNNSNNNSNSNNSSNNKKKANNKNKNRDQKKKPEESATSQNASSSTRPKAAQHKKVKEVTGGIQVLSLTSGSTTADSKESKISFSEQAGSAAKTEGSKPASESPIETEQLEKKEEEQEEEEATDLGNQNEKSQDSKQNTYNKKYQRRNSESFNKYNNQSGTYSQRSHRFNKNYNSFRNNTYPNVPYFVSNFNYGYGPVFNPAIPGQAYPYQANFRAQTKSNSGSPATTSPALHHQALTGSSSPFIRNHVLNYPFIEDPLTLVINQLNYYFSIENLVKDTYLRKQMNSNGFVPLAKLIEFNRLKTLTANDINVLINALSFTPHLEVVNGKVRVREGWANWVLPHAQRDISGKEEDE